MPIERRDDFVVNGNKYKLPIVLMYGNTIQKNEPRLAVKESSIVSSMHSSALETMHNTIVFDRQEMLDQ
jgi:hypothetical protein